MGRNRKALLISFSIFGATLVMAGFLIKLQHWQDYIFKIILASGYVVTALTVALAVKFSKSK